MHSKIANVETRKSLLHWWKQQTCRKRIQKLVSLVREDDRLWIVQEIKIPSFKQIVFTQKRICPLKCKAFSGTLKYKQIMQSTSED